MPMTRLAAFLAASGLNQTEFAARIGVQAATINRYVSRAREPKRSIGRKIDEVTFGLINRENYADLITETEADQMMAEFAARKAAAEAGEVARG